jgi:hypothetical protein
VNDLHAEFLRAHLADEEEAIRRANERLNGPGGMGGLAVLTQAALAIAARRKFTAEGAKAGVSGYVARINAVLSQEPESLGPLAALFDARAAESELRGALGESVSPWPDVQARGCAQLLLLDALVQDLELDEAAVDELLSEARALAG